LPTDWSVTPPLLDCSDGQNEQVDVTKLGSGMVTNTIFFFVLIHRIDAKTPTNNNRYTAPKLVVVNFFQYMIELEVLMGRRFRLCKLISSI